MKKIKVDKVILYYMDRVDPDGNPYRFYVYKGMASEIEYFCTEEAGNMTIPIGEGEYVKIVPKEIENMERAFECGDYVCIEVGKLPYNVAFGYIHNLQEISSQAISRLTDTKDCSRDVAFAMIRVWAKEFTEKYEDYKFDGDYYDLVDEFIDGKLSDLDNYETIFERITRTLE